MSAAPLTFIGSTGYHLSARDIGRVRAAAQFSGLDWRAIAARPSTALDFCAQVEAERAKLRPVCPSCHSPRFTSNDPRDGYTCDNARCRMDFDRPAWRPAP